MNRYNYHLSLCFRRSTALLREPLAPLLPAEDLYVYVRPCSAPDVCNTVLVSRKVCVLKSPIGWQAIGKGSGFVYDSQPTIKWKRRKKKTLRFACRFVTLPPCVHVHRTWKQECGQLWEELHLCVAMWIISQMRCSCNDESSSTRPTASWNIACSSLGLKGARSPPLSDKFR